MHKWATPIPPTSARAWEVTIFLAVLILLYLPRYLNIPPDFVDHDRWRQTDTATIAANFLDEPNILYPRINWGAPGPGYVESEFQLYPYMVSLLYRVFGEDARLGRYFSILMMSVSSIFVYLIGRRYLKVRSALVLLVIYSLTPFVFRYSRVFMPEATVMAFYTIALWAYLFYLDKSHWSYIFAATAAASLAFLVKPTSIHLLMVFFLFTIITHGWRRLVKPDLVLAALVAMTPMVLYYVHAYTLWVEYGNTFGVLTAGDTKWGNPSDWLTLSFYVDVFSIDRWYTFGKFGMLVFLAGLGWSYRNVGLRSLLIAGFISILLYYLITGRYSSSGGMGTHYHVYSAVYYSLAFSYGIQSALRTSILPVKLLAIAFSLLALSYMFEKNHDIAAEHSTVHLDAGRVVADFAGPGDRIVVLSQEPTLHGSHPNNYEQPDVFYHARRTGRALGLDQQTVHDLKEIIALTDARWYLHFENDYLGENPRYTAFLADSLDIVYESSDFALYRVPTALGSTEED